MGCVGATIIGFILAVFMIAMTDAGFFGSIGLLLVCPMVVFIMVGMVSKQ